MCGIERPSVLWTRGSAVTVPRVWERGGYVQGRVKEGLRGAGGRLRPPEDGGVGGFGLKPWYLVVCCWRRPSASLHLCHCLLVSRLVLWLCQWNRRTCPVPRLCDRSSQRRGRLPLPLARPRGGGLLGSGRK